MPKYSKTEIQDKYTDPEKPGSFTSLATFKKNNPELEDKTKFVENALDNLEAFSLHRPVYKNFKKVKTNVAGIDDSWQIDLIDVHKLYNKKERQAFNFIFTCIDVFSKFAWAYPMSDKTAEESRRCIEKIFSTTNRRPKNIYCDQGNEFEGNFKKFLEKNNIEKYTTSVRYDYKAGIVERFNRTLKEKLWRYFTYKNAFVYVDVLDKLLSSYNNTIHTSLQLFKDKDNSYFTPKQVSENLNLAEEIYKQQTDNNLLETFDNPLKFRFNIGDYVRTSIIKKDFKKGYTANWSKEVFCVSTQIASYPPRYKITSLQNGKELDYTYNNDELIAVPDYEYPYDTFLIRPSQNSDQVQVQQLNDENQDEKEIMSKQEIDVINANKINGEKAQLITVPKKRGRKTREEKAKENQPKIINEPGVTTRSRAKTQISKN